MTQFSANPGVSDAGKSRGLEYRPEIDGLRALAVVPVILFHAGFEWFRGGYVGVDVFFVISGYLITSIILREREAGAFSLANFYERRARRILPALFVVVLACLPFAWLWMMPQQFAAFSRSLIAVALFGSNVWFARNSGYFDAVAEENPLLHTWSLGVEEQYYVLYPLFIVSLWRFGPRRLIWIVAILLVLSLGLSELAWRHGRIAANFFLTPTRAWELLAGSLAALVVRAHPGFQRSDGPGNLCSSVGVLLILVAVVSYDLTTPFPSIYALVPTAGTALILVFGVTGTWAARVLASKWLVGIGLVSYSAYLWHQPLFAFARIYNLDKPSPFLMTALAAAAIALGYLTWHFVERPARNRRAVTRWQIVAISIFGTLATIGVGLAGDQSNGFESRFEARLPAGVMKSFALPERIGECFNIDNAHALVKGWYCEIDRKLSGQNPQYVLFGDSHALALLPAFESASRESSKQGIFTGFDGCPPLLSTYQVARSDQALRDCKALNDRMLAFVKGNGIKKIFLAARWTYYTDGDYDGSGMNFIGSSRSDRATRANSRKAFELGLASTVDAYCSLGVRVHIVRQVPQQLYSAQRIYFKAFFDSAGVRESLARYSVKRQQNLRHNAFVSSVFGLYESNPCVTFVDLDDVLCNGEICPVGTETASYFRDNDHVNNLGAGFAVPAIVRLLN